LAIVKHICLAHRGEVRVEGTPGGGSTFSIRIPRLPAEGSGERPIQLRSGRSQRS
jgi:signal transduction histidine kinase